MKIMKQILILLILSVPVLPLASQTAKKANTVFAPFISMLTIESRGSSILLTWKDSQNLKNPQYHIYGSETPFDPLKFIYEDKIALVNKGIENYSYKPGDSTARYFLVLAEEEGEIYDVFIPYRNMSMQPVAAEETIVQEEMAARISSLKVLAGSEELSISAESTNRSRPLILYRSNKELRRREDLAEAVQVKIFENEPISYRDPVIPGIPFYYALVDKALYESGSEIILYDGSVTEKAVSLPLEEWARESAHSFHFSSRPFPLPLLNVNLDIETGRSLPAPGLPELSQDLEEETEKALASLDYAKSVQRALWKQPELLPLDQSLQAPPETAWVAALMESGQWDILLNRCETELKSTFDREIRSRLYFYKGQALYFTGELEQAFMDFMSSRGKYYSQSNKWLFSIYEQRRRISLSRESE